MESKHLRCPQVLQFVVFIIFLFVLLSIILLLRFFFRNVFFVLRISGILLTLGIIGLLIVLPRRSNGLIFFPIDASFICFHLWLWFPIESFHGCLDLCGLKRNILTFVGRFIPRFQL